MTKRYRTTPDVIAFAHSLSSDQRKSIARTMADLACRSSDAVKYLGEQRMLRLLNGESMPTHLDREYLAGDVDDLDEQYFAVVEQYNGLDPDGKALKWFRHARAAAALLYSLDGENAKEFCETLGEAQAATGDPEGVMELCMKLSRLR